MTNSLPTSEKWDSIRQRFRSSIMAKTEIHKLAQNIDASWPLRGKEETPEKYLSLTLEELVFFPEFKDKPERIQLLISILEETLAFDDPFGEMVEYVDSASQKDNSALRTLQKLSIPETFPIALTQLSSDTKSFCETEGIQTLMHFIDFAQGMAQSIVVGGDFKRLLNSLTHTDEATIATLLPLRRKESGLHLAESLALFANSLSPSEKNFLFQSFDRTPESSEIASARPLGNSEKERLSQRIKNQVALRMNYFEDEAAQLENLIHQDERQQERFFIPIQDNDREQLAWILAQYHFNDGPPKSKKGLLNRFFGR